MQTYTVHEPYPVADTLDERAARLIFIKEGFALWAFILPVVWLLLNRLWLMLLLFVIATVGVVTLVTVAGGTPTAAGWATFMLNLIFGFEARNIRRGFLARQDYELIGVVTGRDLEDAERRFLSEWLPTAATANAAAPVRAMSQSYGGSVPAVGMSMAT